MTNAIKLKLFGQEGCTPCKIVNLAIEADADEFVEAGVDYEYIDMTKGVRSDREELKEKYGISGTPVVIIERNGHKMADIRGLVNIREVWDGIEYAKTAK